MSYAVQSVAMQIPNLKLIYRDVDAPPHLFTMLDYSERPVTTEEIEGPQTSRQVLKQESWEWIFSRNPTVRTAGEIVGAFRTHIVPAAGERTP